MILPSLALSLVAVFQDPEPAPPPKPEGTPPAAQDTGPAFEVWDDSKAKEVLKEVKELTKGRRVPMAKRVQAVEKMAAGSNRKLVPELAKMVATDDSVVVKQQAAAALGHQPTKDAKKAIVKLLGDDKMRSLPQVLAPLVDAFAKNGYEDGDWQRVMNGMFEREYSPETVPLQKAILRLITQHEEKAAIDLLLDNLGEPVPADPDDASNPPAEYWEARWKAWEVWREDVKTALFEITGQRFSTKAEARAWLEKNGKSIGIR